MATWDDPATAKANVIRGNGSIPLEAYFVAALAERGAGGSVAAVAAEHGLNAKYFEALWNMLNQDASRRSLVLNRIRALWRRGTLVEAKPLVERSALAAGAQFDPIGHIGREGGRPRG